MNITQVPDRTHSHVRTCEPVYCISGASGRIVLKFDRYVAWDLIASRFTQDMGVGTGASACAEVHFSISREHLDALYSNFVCGYGSTGYAFYTSRG